MFKTPSVNHQIRSRIACATTALALSVLLAPATAFAEVAVDNTPINQGENSVGGGTATLTDSVLDMVNVVANDLTTDEDLTVNFNGGNEIDNVIMSGSADVELNYTGDNEAEDVTATENANVTINANGHNDFDDVTAVDNANVTINVDGENDFEAIEGYDNSTITVRGTTCQMRDTINLGEDDNEANIFTDDGKLTIDHVTINLEGENALIGSMSGDVVIDTSKIAKDDGNEYAQIMAGNEMRISESVIEISGAVWSGGQMTIEHSDVEVTKPDEKYDNGLPYRVFSFTGIELIREKNGEVKQGTFLDNDIWYVDTGDGEKVDLRADGKPAYYKCGDEDTSPSTGDGNNPYWPMPIALASVATAAFARKRMEQGE